MCVMLHEEHLGDDSFLFADLWPGGSAGLGQAVAAAPGPHRHPSGAPVHPAALLPRESSLPAHQPQEGGAGMQRCEQTTRNIHFFCTALCNHQS